MLKKNPLILYNSDKLCFVFHLSFKYTANSPFELFGMLSGSQYDIHASLKKLISFNEWCHDFYGWMQVDD